MVMCSDITCEDKLMKEVKWHLNARWFNLHYQMTKMHQHVALGTYTFVYVYSTNIELKKHLIDCYIKCSIHADNINLI